MTQLELIQHSKSQTHHSSPTLKEKKGKVIHISFHVVMTWFFRGCLKDKFEEVYIPFARKGAMCLYLMRGKRSHVN